VVHQQPKKCMQVTKWFYKSAVLYVHFCGQFFLESTCVISGN